MAHLSENRDAFRRISHEVGERLAERRNELDKSLRVVAAEAKVSTSHLSDIENGICQVSLPTLMRIVRSLDLTITELLPRIGGHQVKRGSIDAVSPGSAELLSHEQLELDIQVVNLVQGTSHQLDNSSHQDVLLHLLSGIVAVVADGAEIRLQAGDTLDTERVNRHTATAIEDSLLLVAIGGSGN